MGDARRVGRSQAGTAGRRLSAEMGQAQVGGGFRRGGGDGRRKQCWTEEPGDGRRGARTGRVGPRTREGAGRLGKTEGRRGGLDRRGAGEEGRLRERGAVYRCRCVCQLCSLPGYATIAHDNKKGLPAAIPSPPPDRPGDRQAYGSTGPFSRQGTASLPFIGKGGTAFLCSSASLSRTWGISAL